MTLVSQSQSPAQSRPITRAPFLFPSVLKPLKRDVHPDQQPDPEDSALVSSALAGLGHGAKNLFSSIKDFQAAQGLKTDGWLRPGGPTYQTLNAAVAGGLGAAVPAGKDRESWLSDHVLPNDLIGFDERRGLAARNKAEDLFKFKRGASLILPKALGGLFEEELDDFAKTRAQITAIQQAHGLEPNGWMGPGSETQQAYQGQIESMISGLAKGGGARLVKDPEALWRRLHDERSEDKPLTQSLFPARYVNLRETLQLGETRSKNREALEAQLDRNAHHDHLKRTEEAFQTERRRIAQENQALGRARREGAAEEEKQQPTQLAQAEEEVRTPPKKPDREVQLPEPELAAESNPASKPNTGTKDLIDTSAYVMKGDPKPSIGSQMATVQTAHGGVWVSDGDRSGPGGAGYNGMILVDPVTRKPINALTGKPTPRSHAMMEPKGFKPLVAHTDDMDASYWRVAANRAAAMLPTEEKVDEKGQKFETMSERFAAAASPIGQEVFAGALARSLSWEKGANTFDVAQNYDSVGGATFLGISSNQLYGQWLALHEGDPYVSDFPREPEGYADLTDAEKYAQSPVFKLTTDQVAYIAMTEFYAANGISRLTEVPQVVAPENRTFVENVFDFAFHGGGPDAAKFVQGEIYDLLEEHDPEWLTENLDLGEDSKDPRGDFADGHIGEDTLAALGQLLSLEAEGTLDDPVLKTLNQAIVDKRSSDKKFKDRAQSFGWPE